MEKGKSTGEVKTTVPKATSENESKNESKGKVEAKAKAKVETKEDSKTGSKGTSKDGLYKITNKTLKDCSVVAVTGDIIAFDKDGIAYVREEDKNYLINCNGFEG